MPISRKHDQRKARGKVGCRRSTGGLRVPDKTTGRLHLVGFIFYCCLIHSLSLERECLVFFLFRLVWWISLRTDKDRHGIPWSYHHTYIIWCSFHVCTYVHAGLDDHTTILNTCAVHRSSILIIQSTEEDRKTSNVKRLLVSWWGVCTSRIWTTVPDR